MTYEEYKSQVCDLAVTALKSKPWYAGVCLDTLPGSYQEKASIEEAAQRVIDDTRYWDAH